jgi:ribA/ribD-fused uncharacterized protein
MKRKPIPGARKTTKANGYTNGQSNNVRSSQDASLKSIRLSEIRFYRANERPFGVFSNLYKRPIAFEGQSFPTAEHAYQAGKANKPAVKEWILSAPSPALLAMAAHGLYAWDIVPNWNEIKLARMRNVLRAKFTQHADLRQLLLSTESARLIEAGNVSNAVNRYWGEVNGKGKNMLGVLLMELRAELRRMPTKAIAATASKRTLLRRGQKLGKSPRFSAS